MVWYGASWSERGINYAILLLARWCRLEGRRRGTTEEERRISYKYRWEDECGSASYMRTDGNVR